MAEQVTRTGPPQVKAGILEIEAYKPGKAGAHGVEKPVKLSANENILGCSEHARAAVAEAIADLNLYPDGRGSGLREAISAHYRIEPGRIVLGCGTDEIFQLINDVFLTPGDNIVQGEFGFGAYAIGARKNQAEVRYAAEPNYRVSVDAMLANVDARTRLVWIANPANPTGTFVSIDEICRLQQSLPPQVMMVLDGAYADFADDPTFDDGLDLARTAANVIVTRTFSKIHGLANLRVGWGYMHQDVAEAIDRVRLPFNTTLMGQRAAVAALADLEFQRRSKEHVLRWRPWLTQQLGGLGLEVVPSQANFVLVRFPQEPERAAPAAEAFLASRGLIVRGVGGYGLPDHLRITIGLEEHNRALIDALAEFLGK
jgi:histidinol-phosphate aminotransferase